MTRPLMIELSAGAGGSSLGAIDAGFDVHGIEIDEDAVSTHRRMVGPCDRSEIECWRPWRGCAAAVVGGGVPCTTFSPAGDRAGLRDPKGQLFRHILRIADETGAEAVWMENSDGITTWRDVDGTTASAFIEQAFREAGWHTTSAVLCAMHFGVPQARYRWLLVGFRDAAALARFRWPSPTHGEPGNLLGLPAYVTVREALGLGGERFATGKIDGATGWNGQRFVDVDKPATTTTTSRNNADLLSPLDEPAPTIRTRVDQGPIRPGQRDRIGEIGAAVSRLDAPSPTITASIGKHGISPSSVAMRGHALAKMAAEVCEVSDERANDLSDALEAAGLNDRPATTLQAAAGGRLSPSGHHERQFPAIVADDVARTIDTTNGLQQPGNHARQKPAVRLSVEQCARLQDFPPGFVFSGETKSSQHAQIGNAFPRSFAAAVFRQVHAALFPAAQREAAE